MGWDTLHTTMEDLKHLFGVFLEKALLDLTYKDPPNTPIFQDQSPAGLDVAQLKQLLVKLIRDSYPSVDLDPIRTTSDDFESFEKWAQESTPQFKKIVETYEPPAPFSFRRNMLTLV